MVAVNTDIVFSIPISILQFTTENITIYYMWVHFIIQNNWPIFY